MPISGAADINIYDTDVNKQMLALNTILHEVVSCFLLEGGVKYSVDMETVQLTCEQHSLGL